MKKLSIVTASVLSAMILSGCGGDDPLGDNSNNTSDTYLTAVLNTGTAAEPKWAYFDFDTGSEVEASDNWDIAFKRMEVKVNDNLRSAIIDKKEAFYQDGQPVEEAFVNVDDLTERDNFYRAVTVEDSDYVSNGIKTAINDEWYAYNFQTHLLTPNDDNYWYIQSSTGDSYAKMHASAITPEYIATFSFYVQSNGSDSFNPTAQTIDINLTSEAVTCYDFDAGMAVACETAEWDVQFDIKSRSYVIKLNGGVSGSGQAVAFGPAGKDDFTSGTDQGLAFSYKADAVSNIFSEYTPWAYGVAGGHSVWPNYRTYVVDLGEGKEPVKLQLIQYYDPETAASGTVTFRYMSLSDDGAQ